MRIGLDMCLNNIQKSRCEHNDDADRHGAVLGEHSLKQHTFMAELL